MTFENKIKLRKKAYTGGSVVNNWLQSAYQTGVDDTLDELVQRMQKESQVSDSLTSAGILRALGILIEYQSKKA